MVIISKITDFMDSNGNFIGIENFKVGDAITVFYGGEIGDKMPLTMMKVYRIQLQ